MLFGLTHLRMAIDPDPFAPGLLRRFGEAPCRVALLRASRLGDFVCATPAFRALRAALPRADITLIGLPFIEPLAKRLPSLDRFLPFPGYPGAAEQFFNARRALRFLARVQRERFDLLVQMHGSGVYMNPFALMCGAKWTAGFTRDRSRSDLLDAALPLPPPMHEIDRLLALTEFLGAPAVGGARPQLGLRQRDRREAALRLTALQRPVVALQPGARETRKRWALERFISVGEQLRARCAGSVVVIGGPEEAKPGDAIAARLGAHGRNLAGRVSLPVLAGVIERVSLLVTNDSGPAHMAYALGTPSITIFGGTDPRMWAGRAAQHLALAHPIACRPCDEASCPIEHQCLRAIGVEEVVREAEALLSSEA